MTDPKPKLPALDPADIEALPDAAYTDGCGERLLKWTDSDGEVCFSHFDARPNFSSQKVAGRGGITARLVDPAPLVELLEKLLKASDNYTKALAERMKADCTIAGFVYHNVAKEVEAALEGNDG